jgi:probable rRNA maturation factor
VSGAGGGRDAAGTIEVDVRAVGVRVPIGRERVAELARDVLASERVRAAHLSITFVDAGEMARLNWRHLRHRGPTDVISFELPSPPGAPRAGDVYIAPEVARANALAHRCGVREEVARLVVHGTLHVLGHDHPEGAARTASRMWRRQERLLARLLPAARSGGA